MKVRALTFEQFHGKHGIGSTNIRVRNLMKFWPDYKFYTYGEKPDVMIFQKVYELDDYHFIQHLDCIKILDICDPDWYQFEVRIKQTVDAVDAVTCPTQEIRDFIAQMTDKPVVVVPDRFVIDDLPEPRLLNKEPTNLVWFGYSHNAEVLKQAIWSIEDKYRIDSSGERVLSEVSPYKLTVISNDDPAIWRAATNQEAFQAKYTFKKYDNETIRQELNKFDLCLLPPGGRPQDRFKSNNKTVLAYLSGCPVVTTMDELNAMKDYKKRNAVALQKQKEYSVEYNVVKSVEQMKELIDELKKNK